MRFSAISQSISQKFNFEGYDFNSDHIPARLIEHKHVIKIFDLA